jgi:hypothetical protein
MAQTSGAARPRFHVSALRTLYRPDSARIELARRRQASVWRGEKPERVPCVDYGFWDERAMHKLAPADSWDESFLIFDGPRPDALGGPEDTDFYISFRNPDGSWSPAAHFLEISSTKEDMTASLSPDGNYIFFFQHGDLGWVSAEIVERYRPNPAVIGADLRNEPRFFYMPRQSDS